VLSNSFFLGTGLAGIGFVVLMLLLPESLHKEDRNSGGFDPKLHTPIGIFFVAFRNPYLFCVWFCGVMAWMSAGANEAVFLGWWARRYGQSNTMDIVMFLVYGWVLGGFGTAIMTKVYVGVGGIKFATHFSIIVSIITAAILASAPSVQMSYVGATVGFFAGPSVPAVLSILMAQVGPHEKGLMSGTYRTSEALGKFTGSYIFGTMFAGSIAKFTPDESCIPPSYDGVNTTNACDCGVNSCPDFTGLAPVWKPKECDLGSLSHRWHESSSKTIKKGDYPTLGAHYWFFGPSQHDETCQTLGGPKLFGQASIGFNVSLPRLWCAAQNPIAGCLARGHFDASQLQSDGYKLATNSSVPLHHDNFAEAMAVFGRVRAGEAAACPESGTLDLELCWADVIAPFPGIIVMSYGVGVVGAGYVAFVVGELLFKGHEYKIVPLDQQE
jgi:hypothetical protein